MVIIMNKSCYLDYNVFLDMEYRNKNSSDPKVQLHNEKAGLLLKKFEELKNVYSFCFSPAHGEEVAKFLVNKSIDFDLRLNSTLNKILLFNKLCDGNSILPSEHIGLYFHKEYFIDNLCRCLFNNGGMNATKLLEEFDEIVFLFFLVKWQYELKSKENNYYIDNYNINGLTIDELFNSNNMKFVDEYYDLVYSKDTPGRYSNFKNRFNSLKQGNYRKVERCIEKLLKSLNFVGYYRDKNYMTSITHDISHAHYATKCNIFITNDKRLRKKVEMIYNYIGCPTAIKNCEEFLAENS